jgi:putative protease
MPLNRAETQPLTTQRLRDQLGRLGGSPFVLGKLENHLSADMLLPISELNRLRREAVSQLQEQRARPPRWTFYDPLRSPRLCVETSPPQEQRNVGPPTPAALQDPQLIVLVRNLAQMETALSQRVQTLYCDFEDPKRYREAVRQFRNSSPTGSQIFVAPPRIFKIGEEWVLNRVRSSEADGYLVRNFDHLRFFANDRCVGDYSFNIANRLAADYIKNKFGLERITASYDLNFTQLEALLRSAPPAWFEITLHQHMPMFHMEHCVFCAFLSTGTDYTNCGRPCDHHDVQLRDRVGAQHPVKADAGCRNTVFNARAQTGAEYAQAMIELGVRNFRIEFVNESPEVAGQTIDKYRQLLQGKITGAQLWRELKLINQLGVTRGQIAGREIRDKARS